MTTAWRLIAGDGTRDALDAPGARNMAVDTVLFDSARSGGAPTLRFYRWTPACLSLGRNQPARGRYDEGRLPGVDVVRRPTGGLAVFHDRELTYSVACTIGVLGSPRESYVRIHTAIARGLAALGVATGLAPLGSRAPDPNDPLGVCFAAPAHGEVLADAGKLVGSAQRTEGRTILQHGSILIGGSQARAAATRPDRSDRSDRRVAGSASTGPTDHHGATLEALLGRTPTDAEMVEALTAGFEAEIGIRLAPGSLSADEVRRLPDAEARYRSDEWTWRS
ncbi:MAG TPA: biotin/lipoate A/B protein ligase family protein [Longimicrobiales bacterium]